jgi:hypothetical protein
MLESLDKVDWQHLRGMKGPATDVPRLIRDLASGDVLTAMKASDDLWGIILHQGNVYEATSYVIPYLIELLSSDVVLDRSDILYSFYTICWVHQEEDDLNDATRKTLAAIQKGVETYIALLSGPDRELRATAAFVLPLLAQNNSRSASAILSRLKVETEPEVKAALAWSLGTLIADGSTLPVGDRDEAVALLGNLIGPTETRQVRFSAAHSLLRGKKAETPSGAVAVLLDGIAHPDLYPTLPGGAVPIWSASEALCELDGERRLAAFWAALELVREPRNAHTIAMTLLDCVLLGASRRRHPRVCDYSDPETVRYGDTADELPEAQTLSAEQKKALCIVVEADKVWERPSNLLAIYGLPASRDDARRLLS